MLISVPSSPMRGTLRDRHECWVQDAVDAAARRDEARSLRTAKPYGPVPPTLGSSLARRFRKATVANKPGTPGRVRSSR